MKITNSTDWTDLYLRRAVTWCAERIGLNPSHVRAVRVTNCARSFRGRAWRTMRVLVRVGPPDKFPAASRYTPDLKLNDRGEALVFILAHELQHLYDYSAGVKPNEKATDKWALAVLDEYRAERESVEKEWT